MGLLNVIIQCIIVYIQKSIHILHIYIYIDGNYNRKNGAMGFNNTYPGPNKISKMDNKGGSIEHYRNHNTSIYIVYICMYMIYIIYIYIYRSTKYAERDIL